VARDRPPSNPGLCFAALAIASYDAIQIFLQGLFVPGCLPAKDNALEVSSCVGTLGRVDAATEYEEPEEKHEGHNEANKGVFAIGGARYFEDIPASRGVGKGNLAVVRPDGAVGVGERGAQTLTAVQDRCRWILQTAMRHVRIHTSLVIIVRLVARPETGRLFRLNRSVAT